MKRALFHVATLLSLVMCLAACAAWYRARQLPASYGNLFYDPRTSVHGQNHFNNTRKAIAVHYLRERLADSQVVASLNRQNPSGLSNWVVLRWAPDRTGVSLGERMGFWFEVRHTPEFDPRDRATYVYVSVPHWFSVLVTGILPVTWTITRLRRSRRLAIGLCPRCGYDLRATPDKCPECGLLAGFIGGIVLVILTWRSRVRHAATG